MFGKIGLINLNVKSQERSWDVKQIQKVLALKVAEWWAIFWSMITYTFTQKKYWNNKDWVTSVEKGLLELDINVTFENIQQMIKATRKSMVRTATQQKTFKKLENMKLTHSKVKILNTSG